MTNSGQPKLAPVCTDCGAPNADRTAFCGGCGAYLQWDGGPEQAVEPAPEPPAVLPARETPRRPVPTTPVTERHTAPDDVPCGECGAGNPPSRRFCSRCGRPLAPDHAAAPTRRRWFRRRTRVRAAGERLRPLRRRRVGPLALLLVGAAVTGLAVANRGTLRSTGEAVRDRVQGTAQINPRSITASSAQPGHPAALVRDGTTNRFWAPTPASVGRGPHLDVTFDRPFRLVYIRIFTGADENLQRYLAQARPSQVDITISRRDASPLIRSITLRDEPGPQQFRVVVPDATAVRITIRSTAGSGVRRLVAVGEIEFMGRS